MSVNDYKIQPGKRELVIKINERRSAPVSDRDAFEREVSRGALSTLKSDHALARRKKPGGIFFYDLGLIRSGANYVEVPYDARVPFTTNTIYGEYAIFAELGEMMILQNLILQVPFDEFAVFYYRMELDQKNNIEGANIYYYNHVGVRVATKNGEPHQVDSISFEPRYEFWTDEKGLILDESLVRREFVIDGGDYFNTIALSGRFLDKITNVFNPGAPADLSFKPSAKMDIFLIPRLYTLQVISSTRFQDTNTDFMFFSGRRVVPREIYRHPERYPHRPIGFPAEHREWIYNRARESFAHDEFWIRTAEIVNGEEQPPSWEKTDPIDLTPSAAYGFPSSYRPGILTAVIRQAGKLFYVWSENTPTDSEGGGGENDT